MTSPRRSTAMRHALVIAIGLSVATSAMALDPAIEKLPGYVDGSSFLDFADPEGTVVEISLPGKILRPFCGALKKQDPDMEVVCELEWIGAIVLEFEGDSAEAARAGARDLVNSKEQQLLDRGWERLAIVREKDELVKVLMLVDDEIVSGLVVFVVEDDEIVFANVAGTIDMEQLGALAEKVPGLEGIDIE